MTFNNDSSPGTEEVARFHDNDDVDGNVFSHHHTLGPRSTQAAAGNHRHDGADSAAIFDSLENPHGSNDPYTGNPLPPYKQGVAVAVGMKNHKKYSETYTSVGDDVIHGTSDPIRVVGGHSYLIRVSFEGRVNVSSGAVRFNLKVKENLPSVPPPGPLVAPPPLSLAAPTTADTSVEHSSFLQLLSSSDTKELSRVYVPDRNGVVRFGAWWRYGPGVSSLELRNITITVMDMGREEADDWNNLWRMMTRLFKSLRKMGAKEYVLGESEIYHT